MAKNLHKDNFEDFLKKSFDGYDDSPSDNLWGKIEGQLPPPPSGIGYYVQKWWLAAVAALLFGVIIYQYVHYNKTIDDLAGQLERNKSEQIWSNDQKAVDNVKTINEKVADPAAIERNKTIDKKEEESIFDKKENNKNIKGADRPSDQSGKIENPVIAVNKNDKPQAGDSPDKKPAIETQAPAHTELIKAPQNLEQKTGRIDNNNYGIPNRIDTKPLAAFTTPGRVVFLPKADLVAALNPLHGQGKFSVGANYMYMNSREQISAVKTRSRPTGRLIFNANRSSGSTTYAGVLTERRFAGGWCLQAGAGYRHTVFNTDHRVKLRFMDRSDPVGMHQGQHDFAYDLNTATGLVEVEVRAEQVDPSQQIDSQEPVNIFISTEEQLEYVSFPLLLKYQFSDHRFHINAKSGLLGNILAKEDLFIAALQITSDKFRTRLDATRVVDQQPLKQLTLDLLLGLELEYDISPAWSIGLSPTYVTSLSGNHNDRFVDSTDRSFGLNIGTLYHF